MTDDDHSTTRTLKRYAPFWGWVRSNPSLIIGGLGIVIGGAVGWHDIESKVDDIENRPACVPYEQFLALKSDFAQLRNEVAVQRSELDQQKGRWQQVDSVPQLTGSHRTRKP